MRLSSVSQNKIWGPVVAIFLIVYFVYHSIQGQRGIISWLRIQQKLEETEKVLTQLQIEKERLERRAHLLRPESLDLDMLEERAQVVLNFSDPNDVVIYGTVNK